MLVMAKICKLTSKPNHIWKKHAKVLILAINNICVECSHYVTWEMVIPTILLLCFVAASQFTCFVIYWLHDSLSPEIVSFPWFPRFDEN